MNKEATTKVSPGHAIVTALSLYSSLHQTGPFQNSPLPTFQPPSLLHYPRSLRRRGAQTDSAHLLT